MRLFTDTSALAKRYLVETGSAWVKTLLDLRVGNTLFIAEIASVEMASLLARHLKGDLLSSTSVSSLKDAFFIHTQQQYQVVAIDSSILEDAAKLTEKHVLRSLDAIQLSCALRVKQLSPSAITFISADQQLLAAASAEGFNIDDPLAHP